MDRRTRSVPDANSALFFALSIDRRLGSEFADKEMRRKAAKTVRGLEMREDSAGAWQQSTRAF